MKIQGPNGLVLSVEESVGRALLVNDGFRQVDETPAPRVKSKK